MFKLSHFSRAQLFVTPWTVAHQSPLSMGFSRQEYWSELPFPSPGALPDPGVEPRSPALQADSLLVEPLKSMYRAVKNPTAMQETQVPSLDQEDPLEKGMVTHSSTLAWRIPWTEEPGRLQPEGQKSWAPLND